MTQCLYCEGYPLPVAGDIDLDLDALPVAILVVS